MTLFILFFLLAVLVSFFCSFFESVLLSISDTDIEIAIHDKKKYGRQIKKLKEDIDKPLSAILTLNTFANTLGAAGVGAQAHLIWGDNIVTLISVILTLTILFFSEITPKMIGATYTKELAPYIVPVIPILLVLMYPFVMISKIIAQAFRKSEDNSIFSRKNLSTFAEVSMNEGILKESEKKIIQNILGFQLSTVKAIMTPRIVLHAENETKTIEEYYNSHSSFPFRRILLYKDSIDNITGFVLKDEVLQSMIENKKTGELSSIKREIAITYESTKLIELFQLLIENNEHIALVLDEYGVSAGIVTIEDLIETLIGQEIMDETDSVQDMQTLAKINRILKLKNLDKF